MDKIFAYLRARAVEPSSQRAAALAVLMGLLSFGVVDMAQIQGLAAKAALLLGSLGPLVNVFTADRPAPEAVQAAVEAAIQRHPAYAELQAEVAGVEAAAQPVLDAVSGFKF